MAEFIVQYCKNWDGGEQEREAATRFIKEACPDAEVTARKINKHPVKVTIFHDDDGELNEIYQCPQRDLFAKYGWPAENHIKNAVRRALK